MKALGRIVATCATTLALVLGSTVTADAATPAFDVTKLSANDLVVSTGYCLNTTARMAHKQNGAIDSWSVDAEVTKNGARVISALFTDNGDTSRTRVQVCPSLDGLGKYKIGPSQIFAEETYWEPGTYWESTRLVSRTDYTSGSFYVRAKVKVGLNAKRRGKKVTLSASTTRYDPERKYSYITYNPKKARFQVKSGSKWKTIKTVRFSKGKASYTVSTRSKRSYRIVIDQVSWAAGATSRTVKR